MVFQPPITPAKALEHIHDRSWVLPAIQREFIWDDDQIRRLFDSLLRSYPLGSFLFWSVGKDQAQLFRFYDFLADYHERNSPYAPVAHVPVGREVTAILDGQQRLTALNIGLRGSYAERLPRKWYNNPDAYPRKELYLHLLNEAGDEELGMDYDFRFLTQQEAQVIEGSASPWYRVADVLSLDDGGPSIMAALEARGLSGTPPFKRLHALYHAIREKPSINAYLEESQEADRVLNIFVRVNSGGTQLSYSDLLLSMATNQWVERDAREDVRSLLSELNNGSREFAFSKDQILKAGLVLTEASDFRFRVSNFTQANMERMEKQWLDIRAALLGAARLLASLGFSARTLTAHSVIIPVAYYMHVKGLGETYLTSSSHAHDRTLVGHWVARSLLKRGTWGSGLDTLLARIRDVIRDTTPGEGFPVNALETVMGRLGKSLQFTVEEVSELTELRYGQTRVFAVLALLYPGLDLNQEFHVDHIFPRSRFSQARLRKLGVPADEINEYTDRVNGLGNLQLLPGLPNGEKQNTWPWDWMSGEHFPSQAARVQYETQNDLDLLPNYVRGFVAFYEARRERLEWRLRRLLGVASDKDSEEPSVNEVTEETEQLSHSSGGLRMVSRETQVREFHHAMVGVYEQARDQAGYNATYFLRMVSERGGLETARQLLRASQVSQGFSALWERRRLDLSVEATVLRPEFSSLFTDDELAVARSRLEEYGYRPQREGGRERQ